MIREFYKNVKNIFCIIVNEPDSFWFIVIVVIDVNKGLCSSRRPIKFNVSTYS
jgi:hypothetical protein